jgi:hypothetical protein
MTIGMGVFGFGQVVVEADGETPHCPGCGTPVSDEGECLVEFGCEPNPQKEPELAKRAPLVLTLRADCRSCGYIGPGPTLSFINPFAQETDLSAQDIVDAHTRHWEGPSLAGGA